MVNSASEVTTAKWLLKFGYPSVILHNWVRDRIRISGYLLTTLLMTKSFCNGHHKCVVGLFGIYIYCNVMPQINITATV